MLFDLGTNKAMSVPQWASKAMREDFPDFYKSGSIKLKAVPERYQRQQRVRSDDHQGPKRILMVAPEPTSHKAFGSIIIPDGEPNAGDTLNFQYTTTQPGNVNGVLKFNWPGNSVTLSDGMSIDKSTQEDLLFYLIYGCAAVKGNKTGKTRKAWYEFDMPAKQARQTIEDHDKATALKDFLFKEVDYATIAKTMNVIGMQEKVLAGDKLGTEDFNRVALWDKLKLENKSTSDTVRENALETLGYQKPKKKEGEKEENESDLFNRLSADGKIKFDDGGWYNLDKRGNGDKFKTKPFFETTATGDDARFALINYWKATPTAFEEFKKL
jgi:hypothetical protein